MKKINIIKGLLVMLLMAFTVASCEDYNEPLLTDIGASRAFTPIALTAKVSKQTTVTVSWTPSLNTDHYVIDFSAGDPNFANIYKTMNVTDKDIPVVVVLEGLTKYYIRVRAVSSIGAEDSKYTVVTVETLGEELFLPSVDGDIKATSAILRWEPNIAVTNITLTPGNINHIITANEKVSGIANITGLTPETTYTAHLMNGTVLRGTTSFKTAVDIGNGILLNPTDDLIDKINNAAPGTKFYLSPGDYNVPTGMGAVTLAIPISLYGLYSYDKPKVHLNFVLNSGASDLKLQDLDLSGDKGATNSLIQINATGTAGATYGDISISSCDIHDYGRSLVSATSGSTAKVNSFKVDNSILTNMLTSGGDFIDFRNTYVASLSLTNSTFNNCAVGRHFVRVDAGAGTAGGGANIDVLIDACTIYNKNMTATTSSYMVHVRAAVQTTTVRNTLFADTPATYGGSITPTFSKNNYHNSPNLIAAATPPITGARLDTSPTLTTLDPQFVDAANGDFKVKNQTLIDNKVGDPRWLK